MADVAALEARAEGWIAGLQLAAISMRDHKDTAGFIQSFTGSHRFVMDYLLEEVLHQQPESIQAFLLRTSVLDRMCGPLCDAVLLDPSVPGQATLEVLERANLFIVPLDNERRWYRYHHIFGDLLRKRLGRSLTPDGIAGLHIHASEWYENNDLMLEAFRHAAGANEYRTCHTPDGKQEDAPAPARHCHNDTELAGVAAEILAGCQTCLVVDAGCDVADHRATIGCGRETPGTRSSPGFGSSAGRLAGRYDPRPDRKNRRRQGKCGDAICPGRTHPGPGAPRLGISAPR